MMTELGTLGLIQDGERDPPGKWPLKDVVIITLHHVNKQSNVFSNTAVHTIQVDSHTQLIPIQAGVEGWTVNRCHYPVDGILATLTVIFNPPDV